MTGRLNEVVVSEGIQRLGGDDFDEAILKLVRKGAGLRRCRGHPRSAARGVLSPQRSRRSQHPSIPGRSHRGRQAAVLLPDRGRLYGLCSAGGQDDCRSLPVCCTTGPAATSTGPRSRASTWWAAPEASRSSRGRCARRSTRNGSSGHCTRSPRRRSAWRPSSTGRPGFALSERLSRHFGVFREACAGEDVYFDPIVPKGAALPTAGQPPFVVTRTYRAAHNIGHFRFVECSRLRDGRPDGDVTPYDPVFFPFDPDLNDDQDLPRRPVQPPRRRPGCRGALRHHVRWRRRGHPDDASGPTQPDVPVGASRPRQRVAIGQLAPSRSGVQATPLMWLPPSTNNLGAARDQRPRPVLRGVDHRVDAQSPLTWWCARSARRSWTGVRRWRAPNPAAVRRWCSARRCPPRAGRR